MTDQATQLTIPSTTRRRWTRAAGWASIALGVIISWVWSVELTLPGQSVRAALSGAVTMLLFCAGIVLLWRVSPHRGRKATWAFRAAAIATALGAIAAGIVPVAVIAATTGTATAEVSSGTTGDNYRVAGVAIVSSDKYHQTTVDLTVRASDRTTPQLVATVSFTDGTTPVTCANTRQTWTHDVSTVGLVCENFTPLASLKAISGIAVSER